MATTIVLKNSVTTTNVPSSLAQGEVAINVTDKKVWVGNAATTPIQIVNGGPDGVFTSVTDSGLTNTRVTYAGAGGLLKDSASITTDGTTVTAGGFSGPVGASSASTGAFTTLTATNFNAASTFGFKNRLINGDMRIDQRNAGASYSLTPTDVLYTLDRWLAVFSQVTKFTVQQNAGSVTPPAGFINYLGCTSTSAYSVGTNDYFLINQLIEGLNIADLGWGTANAQTITISAWVRSSLTGTFGGALTNSAQNRSYAFTYSIPTANTWTKISVTIAGDTSGTWLTTNGTGMRVRFGLGSGSALSGTAGSWAAANYVTATGAVSLVGTSGATFYITGVQVETGSSATGFEYVDYTTQLAMCQRYYQVLGNAVGNEIVIGAYGATGATVYQTLPCKVTMRTLPTGVIVGTWYISNTAQPVFSGAGSSAISLAIVATATGALVTASSTSAYFTLSAEL